MLSPLALAVLFLGLYPAPVLNSLQPAIGKIRHEVLAAVQQNTASSMALKTSTNSGKHLVGAAQHSGMLGVVAPIAGGSNVTVALRLPARLAR